MSRPQSIRHWYSQLADNSRDHILQCITLIRILYALQHLAKNNSAHPVKLPGQLQLHEHTINLIRFGGEILQKQNCAVRLNLVGRAQRSHQNREASAVQNPFRRAFDQSADAGLCA